MNLRIEPGDGVPIYLQIVEQVKRAVALGGLKPEEGLPSVRQLAVELTINPNTVARAYLELEHQGVIYKRQGQGTFVSAQASEASKRDRQKIVGALFEKALIEAVNSGMAAAEIEEIYRHLIHRYKLETP
ncbi:MAG TPA: GntR family transcriptional regulator [Bryobacteraceae bacterium]|nr:GntR family transcriptional regulator [Bryobacteraceae bacterium]